MSGSGGKFLRSVTEPDSAHGCGYDVQTITFARHFRGPESAVEIPGSIFSVL